jgi:hypothetical protein
MSGVGIRVIVSLVNGVGLVVWSCCFFFSARHAVFVVCVCVVLLFWFFCLELLLFCCCFPIPAVLALGVFVCSRECAVCFVASPVVVFCLVAFSLSWHLLCLELWLNNINHLKKKIMYRAQLRACLLKIKGMNLLTNQHLS